MESALKDPVDVRDFKSERSEYVVQHLEEPTAYSRAYPGVPEIFERMMAAANNTPTEKVFRKVKQRYPLINQFFSEKDATGLPLSPYGGEAPVVYSPEETELLRHLYAATVLEKQARIRPKDLIHLEVMLMEIKETGQLSEASLDDFAEKHALGYNFFQDRESVYTSKLAVRFLLEDINEDLEITLAKKRALETYHDQVYSFLDEVIFHRDAMSDNVRSSLMRKEDGLYFMEIQNTIEKIGEYVEELGVLSAKQACSSIEILYRLGLEYEKLEKGEAKWKSKRKGKTDVSYKFNETIQNSLLNKISIFAKRTLRKTRKKHGAGVFKIVLGALEYMVTPKEKKVGEIIEKMVARDTVEAEAEEGYNFNNIVNLRAISIQDQDTVMGSVKPGVFDLGSLMNMSTEEIAAYVAKMNEGVPDKTTLEAITDKLGLGELVSLLGNKAVWLFGNMKHIGLTMAIWSMYSAGIFNSLGGLVIGTLCLKYGSKGYGIISKGLFKWFDKQQRLRDRMPKKETLEGKLKVLLKSKGKEADPVRLKKTQEAFLASQGNYKLYQASIEKPDDFIEKGGGTRILRETAKKIKEYKETMNVKNEEIIEMRANISSLEAKIKQMEVDDVPYTQWAPLLLTYDPNWRKKPTGKEKPITDFVSPPSEEPEEPKKPNLEPIRQHHELARKRGLIAIAKRLIGGKKISDKDRPITDFFSPPPSEELEELAEEIPYNPRQELLGLMSEFWSKHDLTYDDADKENSRAFLEQEFERHNPGVHFNHSTLLEWLKKEFPRKKEIPRKYVIDPTNPDISKATKKPVKQTKLPEYFEEAEEEFQFYDSHLNFIFEKEQKQPGFWGSAYGNEKKTPKPGLTTEDLKKELERMKSELAALEKERTSSQINYTEYKMKETNHKNKHDQYLESNRLAHDLTPEQYNALLDVTERLKGTLFSYMGEVAEEGKLASVWVTALMTGVVGLHAGILYFMMPGVLKRDVLHNVFMGLFESFGWINLVQEMSNANKSEKKRAELMTQLAKKKEAHKLKFQKEKKQKSEALVESLKNFDAKKVIKDKYKKVGGTVKYQDILKRNENEELQTLAKSILLNKLEKVMMKQYEEPADDDLISDYQSKLNTVCPSWKYRIAKLVPDTIYVLSSLTTLLAYARVISRPQNYHGYEKNIQGTPAQAVFNSLKPWFAPISNLGTSMFEYERTDRVFDWVVVPEGNYNTTMVMGNHYKNIIPAEIEGYNAPSTATVVSNIWDMIQEQTIYSNGKRTISNVRRDQLGYVQVVLDDLIYARPEQYTGMWQEWITHLVENVYQIKPGTLENESSTHHKDILDNAWNAFTYTTPFQFAYTISRNFFDKTDEQALINIREIPRQVTMRMEDLAYENKYLFDLKLQEAIGCLVDVYIHLFKGVTTERYNAAMAQASTLISYFLVGASGVGGVGGGGSVANFLLDINSWVMDSLQKSIWAEEGEVKSLSKDNWVFSVSNMLLKRLPVIQILLTQSPYLTIAYVLSFIVVTASRVAFTEYVDPLISQFFYTSRSVLEYMEGVAQTIENASKATMEFTGKATELITNPVGSVYTSVSEKVSDSAESIYTSIADPVGSMFTSITDPVGSMFTSIFGGGVENINPIQNQELVYQESPNANVLNYNLNQIGELRPVEMVFGVQGLYPGDVPGPHTEYPRYIPGVTNSFPVDSPEDVVHRIYSGHSYLSDYEHYGPDPYSPESTAKKIIAGGVVDLGEVNKLLEDAANTYKPGNTRSYDKLTNAIIKNINYFLSISSREKKNT